MKVKAISNFADGSHKQGDVFELDDAEAQRLIGVEAVEPTTEEASPVDETTAPDEDETTTEDDSTPEAPVDDAPLVPEAPAPQTPVQPAATVAPPLASNQPTEEQIAATLSSLEQPPQQPNDTPAK